MKWWFGVLLFSAAVSDRAAADPPADQSAQPAPIDLFPNTALSSKPAPTIRAARAGSEQRPPIALGDAERVTSGSVDPAWRDAERRITTRFQPPVATVADGPRALAAAKQVALMNPTGQSSVSPPNRTLDEEVSAQILACQDAADAPTRWYDVEIETEVDERGVLIDARVVLPSGRSEFDAVALAAVRAALSSELVRDPRGRAVARWRVAAARAVKLPRVSPAFSPGSRRVVGLAPQMPISFDESTGKAKWVVPFSQEVKTRVKLLSVSVRR